MTEQPDLDPRGASPRLSAVEKQAIKRLIDRDQPLPQRYRSALFGELAGPELIWRGKGEHISGEAQSFEVAEALGPAAPPGRTVRGRGISGSPWRNKLFWGDNREVLAALGEGALRRQIEAAGGIRLIYIDPPFDVGADFALTLPIGGNETGRPPRKVKAAAYRDCWGSGEASYLSMMYPRLQLMHELLADGGSLYVHCDWRASAALRLLLDEIFGPERFVNEIVWHYYNKYSAATRCLPRAHDTIWVYSKSGNHVLNELRERREAPRRQLVRENVGGVLKNARDGAGRLMYRMVHDKKGDDVWRIPQLQPASAEWSGYGTQKHHALLERIIRLGSNEGDLVADFFCGSGTTLAAASRLGRKWIGCDAGQLAIHTSRKRLLGVAGELPSGKHGKQSYAGFDLLRPAGEPSRLRRGSRKPLKPRKHPPKAVMPAEGPVMPIEAEFEAAVQVHGLAVSAALSDFRVSASGGGKAGTATAQTAEGPLFLKDGLLVQRGSNGKGGVPETLLTECWADWVDYWAVEISPAPGRDAPAAPRPFAPQWQAFRTYKSRGLPLTSPPQTCPVPGRYDLTVQVIDIFGNIWTNTRAVSIK